jgi:hypothetical protein
MTGESREDTTMTRIAEIERITGSLLLAAALAVAAALSGCASPAGHEGHASPATHESHGGHEATPPQ